MPTTTNLGLTYVTALDPAYADLWGPVYNTIVTTYDSEFATKTINQNFADKELSRPIFKDVGYEAVANASAGTTETLDITSGNVFDITLDDDCTFTFSNPTASGDYCEFMLILRQDGTGGHTPTWPGAVIWPNGVAPTMTSTASAVDAYKFFTVDAGTTWHGCVVGQDFS